MLSRPAPRSHGPPKYLEKICNLIEGQHPGTRDGYSARISAIVCEQISGWRLYWLNMRLSLDGAGELARRLPRHLSWDLAG